MLRKIFVFVLCLVIGSMLAVPAMAVPADKSVITYRTEAEWLDAQHTYPDDRVRNNRMILSFMEFTNWMICNINYTKDFLTHEKSDPSLPDADIDVFVKVRELPDGRAVVTVVETGTNAPAVVCNFDEYWYMIEHYFEPPEGEDEHFHPFYPIIGEQGKIPDISPEVEVTCKTDLLVDYMNVIKFYIPHPLAPLKYLFDIPEEDLISWHCVVNGKGTLSDYAANYNNQFGETYTPGKTAEIKVNQLSLTGGALQSGQYPGLDGWPVEYIKIRQIDN